MKRSSDNLTEAVLDVGLLGSLSLLCFKLLKEAVFAFDFLDLRGIISL